MNTHEAFIFQSYKFDRGKKTLTLQYSIDEDLHFTEKFQFNVDFVSYDDQLLDRALQLLFFMAGVSYYKTFIPSSIVIKEGQLDTLSAAFFSKTYQGGLGEFWYVNKLDPRTPVPFPATSPGTLSMLSNEGSGSLIGIGGGKDSLVTVELLRTQNVDITTWSLNHNQQLAPLVNEIGLPHIQVDRTWDPQLLKLNDQGAYNGHIPISAIFACVGTVVAILTGKKDVVVSNEQSANEPTLHYQGVSINHQYSKSEEFEQDFQTLLQHHFGDTIRYYSFLRPFSELRISELFASIGFSKYKNVFSSCNRAFTHDQNHMSWCGECSKCAFVFMALTPFVDRTELEALWGGKNLLLVPELEATYRQLLGIEGDKPLDCVGEIKESRAAMRLCETQYPELKEKYVYELPSDYDYKNLGTHKMPQDILTLFQQAIATYSA